MPEPVLERMVAERRGGRQGVVCFPEVLFGEGREVWEPLTVPPAAGESVAQQPSGPSQESIAGLCRDSF